MPVLDITNNKIFVAIPRERSSINKFIDSRDRVLGTLSAHDALIDDVMQVESHRVDLNRDNMVNVFLNHPKKPDWLLMLDSDMEHPPDCGLRLREWQKPIVAGLYFHRGESRYHDPMAFAYSGAVMDKQACDYEAPRWSPMRDEVYNWLQTNGIPFMPGPVTINPPRPEGLLKVAAAGTGCMLIHRDVLATFRLQEISPFEYRFRQGSEDLYFCKMAGQRGFQTYVDMNTISGHLVTKSVGHPEFMTVYRNRGYRAAEYDEQDAVRWLTDSGVESAEEAMSNYSQQTFHTLWKSVDPDNALDVEDWYKTTPVGEIYLLDLLYWNASPSFSRLRSKLVGQTRKKVLEIGAGIGTISIQLGIQGCDVTALEINPVLNKFAAMRWAEAFDEAYSPDTVGGVHFISSLGRGRKKKGFEIYDLVVSIDTFEHMHSHDLKEMMQYIGMHTRKGSRLFCHNNWGDQDLYPMHYDHASLWAELTEANGFVQLDDTWWIKAVDGFNSSLGIDLPIIPDVPED